MLKTCFLLLTVGIQLNLYAQPADTGSLVHALQGAKEDTAKVNLYWKAGASLVFQNAPEALPYFKQGAALAKKLAYYPGIEKCYSGISLAFSYNAKYDSALIYIDSAMPYAHKVGNTKRLALAYLNRADVYSNLQNFGVALKNCDTAIQYAEQSGTKDGLGRIYSIMGGIYTSQQQYGQALASLDQAIALFEEINNRQMTGIQYADKADVLAQMNEPDKAIPLYQMAIKIGDSLRDIENLAAYHQGLAQAYLFKNDFDKATQMAGKALTYATHTGNRKQQAMIYEVFSHINVQRENHPAAIAYALKAYNILQEEKDLLREQGSTANLAEEYFKIGNTEEAYKYLKISRDLNDSLLKQQFNEETAKLQTTFQVAQKDKEIQLLNKNKELQEQQIKEQQMITISIAVIALLAVAGTWLLMNRVKLRQRMKELEMRGKIAADLHDEVGSTLSSIRMYSDIVKRQPSQTETAVQLLNKISSNSKETIENMSDIVWMIKPGNDDFSNIENRMLNFANELCVPAGIAFDFTKDDTLANIKMPMEQRRDLYLIFKEAINNAVKYAGCRSIHASIQLVNHHLQMRISDDGNGFDTGTAKRGNGLSNMQQRAAAHKGTFAVQSSPGEGTEIVVVFGVRLS